jgi:tetratricopeptide (TPR) repeat protein
MMSQRWRSTWFLLTVALFITLFIALFIALFISCQNRGAQPRLPPRPLPESFERPVFQQFDERYTVVERLLAVESRNDQALSSAFGNLGMLYHAYQDQEPARLCYRSAHILDSGEFRWAYLLGLVERKLGEHSVSDAAFDEALALRPDDLPSLVWRGENAIDQGRLEEAERIFQKVLEISPLCVQARYGLARTALQAGRPRQALVDLEPAHAAQPQASSILYSLGVAHRSLGDLERATLFFDQVPRSHLVRRGIAFDDPLLREVKALERGAMTHEHRGLKAAAQGRYGVAAAELREAVTLDGDRTEARHNLALALLHLGRHKEAQEEIDEILQHAPTFAPTHILLAGLERQQGLLAEAEEHLRKAVELDPGSAQAHFALAELLKAIGQRKEARESYARARELDPTLEEGKGSPAETPAS